MAKKGMDENSVYQKIANILHNDWNPIGSHNLPANEYENYVPEILELKKSGASAEKIADTLHNIETKNMGFPGTMKHCMQAAEKIMDLPDFFA
jgi:hypothetical protein